MTYAWFVLFQRCASHRTIHMSYRSKTYTWTDVILVKRSMIQVFFYRVTFKLRGHVVRMRPIKVQLSYREWHVTGRTQWYCGTWEVSRSIEPDVSYRIVICARQDAHLHEGAMERNLVFRGRYLTSRRVTLWRHVMCHSDVTFSAVDPQP